MEMPGVPPVVTAKNVYNLATKIAEKSGEKAPDVFFTDPAKAPQVDPGQQPPHPEVVKARAAQQQAQMQAQQAEADRQQQGQIEGAKLQLTAQQAQTSAQLEAQKFAADVQERQANLRLQAEKLERDDAFRHAKLQGEQQREREKLAMQAQLAREGIVGAFAQAVTVQNMKDQNDAQQREADLAIQASEAEDAARMDDDD